MNQYAVSLLYPLSIAGYPLVSAIPALVSLDSRPFSLFFRAVVLGLSLAAILQMLSARVSVYRGYGWLAVLVFWALYSLRLLIDTVLDPQSLSREPADYWLFALGSSFFPMLALFIAPDKGKMKRLEDFTFWSLVFACVLTLAAVYSEIASGRARTLEIGRFESEVLNPISIGHLGGSMLLVAVCLFQTPHSFGLIRKLTILFSVVLGIVILVGAASRGPIVATVSVLMVYAAFSPGTWCFKVRNILGMLLVLSGALIAATLADELGLASLTRVAPTFQGDVDEIRLDTLNNAWHQFLNAPMFGSALEEPITGSYPHNVLVESFMATGFFGGAAFVALLVLGCRASWRLLRRCESAVWVGLLFLQYVIGAQFSSSLWGAHTMWALMAAVLALDWASGRKQGAHGASRKTPSSTS